MNPKIAAFILVVGFGPGCDSISVKAKNPSDDSRSPLPIPSHASGKADNGALIGTWTSSCLYRGENSFGNSQTQYRQISFTFSESTVKIHADEHGTSSCKTEDISEAIVITGAYSVLNSDVDLDLSSGSVTPKTEFDLSYWTAFCPALKFNLDKIGRAHV